MVVARNVIPLAVLMPDHHHTVLPGREETVGLAGPPVFVVLQFKKDRACKARRHANRKSFLVEL